MIHFITGNQNKLMELQAIFGDQIVMLDIDLPEIQEIDARKIIEHKLHEAFAHHAGPFIVEDTSLYIESMQGLPGPLIKWFMQTIGNEGLARIADSLGNTAAVAKTIIGYAKDEHTISYFEGSVSGRIVAPRGQTTFGWDPIFQPDGFEQTFAEMDKEIKNNISMRRKAAEQLREQL